MGQFPRLDDRCPTRPTRHAATRSPGRATGALPGDQLAGVRQGAPAPRQPDAVGDAGGARGLAPAPDGPAGPLTRVLGPGHRDRAPAAPGFWSALAADRRPAALAGHPARGEIGRAAVRE